LKFEQEKLTEALFNEALPLLRDHFAETYPGEEMTVSYLQYAAIAASGTYRIMTMRDEHNFLQGYAGFYVHPHPHKQNSIEALNDLIYVRPHLRNQGYGRELVEFSEAELKAEGVKLVMFAVPKDQNFSPMLGNIGYAPKELIMWRAV
jgi:GNAT superfamily N-acetyltransferase